jgi:DNA mismatch endonuclease (patch repair protein)
MAAVRNRNTSLELRLRKALWAKGLRYRLRYKLPGRPDILFSRKKIAIFCDGCFWHGCPTCNSIPEQNKTFWLDKIKKNQIRDQRANIDLEILGWKVKRYWGCEIKKDLDRVVEEIFQCVK